MRSRKIGFRRSRDASLDVLGGDWFSAVTWAWNSAGGSLLYQFEPISFSSSNKMYGSSNERECYVSLDLYGPKQNREHASTLP
jgi:hypothetical protein